MNFCTRGPPNKPRNLSYHYLKYFKAFQTQWKGHQSPKMSRNAILLNLIRVCHKKILKKAPKMNFMHVGQLKNTNFKKHLAQGF